MNSSDLVLSIALIPACIAPPANFANSSSDKQSHAKGHNHIRLQYEVAMPPKFRKLVWESW